MGQHLFATVQQKQFSSIDTFYYDLYYFSYKVAIEDRSCLVKTPFRRNDSPCLLEDRVIIKSQILLSFTYTQPPIKKNPNIQC